MANETLLQQSQVQIPNDLSKLRLYGVNTDGETSDGQFNASELAQALGGQTGNVANTNYGDLPSVAFTSNDDPQPLYDALNALPLQLVPHGKTYTFSTVRITATSATSFIADKRFYRFRTALTNAVDAQGAYYGVGSGITLNASNMKFRRFEQQIITVENGVVTGTSAYDLGDIGTSSVADAVNGSTSTYTESNGVIVMTATDGTTQQYYIYNGSENVIGNGGNAVTDDDFTTVDPANSVPAASDVYVMGGQLQNLVIEGVQNEVTSVELLATVFKTEGDQPITGDNIPKYFANFEVTSTGVRATLLRRVKLNQKFKPDALCRNATKLDDVQGFITAFGFQDFRGNTNIQEIILPSIRGNSVNSIENNTALTKLVVPKVDTIWTNGCTSLTYLDARGATTLGSLEGCPLTDYLNIDSIKTIAGNLRGVQRTEVDFFNLTNIQAQNITQNSLIEVFRAPLLESIIADAFRSDDKIKELKFPNLTEVNKGLETVVRTFQMTAIELIEMPKCKVFGSDTVSNDMFAVDLSNCKIVVNEHLKTSNNGGINANVQDAIDRGVTVVWVKDYVEADDLLDFNLIKNSHKPAILEASASGWDEFLRENGNVIKVGNTLVQIYSGYSGTYQGSQVYLGITVSNDGGDTWTKEGANGDGLIIDNVAMEDPYIVYNNGTYYVFAENKSEVPFRAINLHTSTDRINWTNQGNVFEPNTTAGLWDSQDVSSPVVLVKGDKFYLFYEGRGEVNGVFNGGAVGLATSPINNINFVKEFQEPIFSGQVINENSSWARYVVPDDIREIGGRYYLLYHGYSESAKYFGSGLAYTDSLTSEMWFDKGQLLVENNNNLVGQDAMFYPSDEGVRFMFISDDFKQRFIGEPANFTKNELDRYFDQMTIDKVLKNGNISLEDLILQGDAPTLFLTAKVPNNVEAGRIRFTEIEDSFQGAYVHYDGSTNSFFIGTNTAGGVGSTASDLPAMKIVRGSRDVQFLGKIKAININFSGIPTSASGLSAGDVWNDGGTLKIV